MDPRGVRNNNPGNVRAGDDWQGMTGQDDKGFAVFARPEDGLRAMSKVLDTYADKHGIPRAPVSAIRVMEPGCFFV